MLQFILGKSGTGKTTLIYDKIKDLIESGQKNIALLVPDQSTFETEKDLLFLLGAVGSKNVRVFGFSSLCKYVYEKTFNRPQNVIDDGTRQVIMNIALEQLSEKLTLFNSGSTRGAASVLLQTLADCKKNNITTNALYTAAKKTDNATLSTKLYETALVFDAFDALVSQSYIDPLDDLTRVRNILLENNLFKDYIFFVDAFSGFNAQQLEVLRLIMNECREMYVSLILDPETDGTEEIFATTNETFKILKGIAKRDFVDIKVPIKLCECKRFSNDELKLLESGIFRANPNISNEAPKNIMAFCANDTYSECEFVAQQIKRLVVKDKLSYSDITVICHDTEPYGGILNVVLEKYNIPYFMDGRSDIEVKPVPRFINLIFRILLDNFEREDVVSLLKTGLTVNTPEEISAFENYLFVWSINHSDFKKGFTQNPQGFCDTMSEKNAEDLKICEKVRRSVTEPLMRFKEETADKTGREITELLYKLMCEMQVPERLKEMYEELEVKTGSQLGAEQIKIWNMLMETLDKAVAIFGDMRLSLKRYYELLSILISSVKLSKIPQRLDSVTVTTAQRVRLSKQKVSFLIGCCDGAFPAVPKASGVFSEFELRQLLLNDIKLSDDFSSLSGFENLLAYASITSPSERLFVSYPRANMLGDQNSPSVIFEEIFKIFKGIKMLDFDDVYNRESFLYAPIPAFEEYAKALSDNSRLSCLSEYFENDSQFASKTKALKRALDNSPFAINNPENAERLFGRDLNISASQIEKFNLCRFSYFCNYGLRIRERKKAEINPMEYGILVHYILEAFFEKYEKLEYSKLSDDEIKSFISALLNDYTEKYFGGEELKTKAFMYRLSVLGENVFYLLKRVITELSQSDFDVSDCELKIGEDIPAYTITLESGHKISVKGSVDRVDVMEKNGEKYLRIVDYKTGSKEFKLSDILYGLNLQMLLYLCSIKKNGAGKYGDILPAGILYMPATVPVVSAKRSFTEKEIEKELDKGLKMNGLILKNIDIINGMDKTEAGKYIPVKFSKGEPVSVRSLATLEEFGKIFNKIDLIIASMGDNLYSGKIPASPAKGAHDACMYCPYDSVCSYRKSEERNTFEIDNDKVFAQIDEELEKGGEA